MNNEGPESQMLHTKFCGNLVRFLKDLCAHNGHHDHVISIMLINFISLYLKASIKMVKNGQPVSEKTRFNFHMYMTLGQGQVMTLTFNTHISSFN